MALGSIGMRLDDFDALTPAEFDAVYVAFERTRIHEQWEQVRFLSTAMLSPHTKKTLKPTDVVKFPWDDKPRQHVTPKVSKEEARNKFDQLIKLIHDKEDIHGHEQDSGTETSQQETA